MEATLMLADDPVDETDDQLVHGWRTEQPWRLGLPRILVKLALEIAR